MVGFLIFAHFLFYFIFIGFIWLVPVSSDRHILL